MPYVVVAYDITDNGRRLRVARKLRNALDRVQRSVYEGEIDIAQVERLVTRVVPLLEEEEDTLRLYLLCAACRRRIRVYGQGRIVEDPDVWIV